MVQELNSSKLLNPAREAKCPKGTIAYERVRNYVKSCTGPSIKYVRPKLGIFAPPPPPARIMTSLLL